MEARGLLHWMGGFGRPSAEEARCVGRLGQCANPALSTALHLSRCLSVGVQEKMFLALVVAGELIEQ